MQVLLIELQDIRDAQLVGISSHRATAVSHIEQGGVVKVTQDGEPVGLAKTVEELDGFLA